MAASPHVACCHCAFYSPPSCREAERVNNFFGQKLQPIEGKRVTLLSALPHHGGKMQNDKQEALFFTS